MTLPLGSQPPSLSFFKWTLTETMEVPPHTGKVYYTAVIIMEIPHMIPFSNNESIKVKVSHGSIYAVVSNFI